MKTTTASPSKNVVLAAAAAVAVVYLSIESVAANAVVTTDFDEPNDLIEVDKIFDLEYATTGNVWAKDPVATNVTKYYCVFRSNWNSRDHPVNFPEAARWGPPILFSGSRDNIPYEQGKSAKYGEEQVAEVRLRYSDSSRNASHR